MTFTPGPPFRDGMDNRDWCNACYRLEFLRNHGTCSCVCHGLTDNVPVEPRTLVTPEPA